MSPPPAPDGQTGAGSRRAIYAGISRAPPRPGSPTAPQAAHTAAGWPRSTQDDATWSPRPSRETLPAPDTATPPTRTPPPRPTRRQQSPRSGRPARTGGGQASGAPIRHAPRHRQAARQAGIASDRRAQRDPPEPPSPDPTRRVDLRGKPES